jgi:DNA-binding NtrC family response regulator
VAHFLKRLTEKWGKPPVTASPEALECLVRYSWPGNVRELEHVIERLLALATGPEIDDEPFGADAAEAAPASGALGLRERMGRFERGLIAEAMESCQGNQSAAARLLGIGRVTLIEKLKRHGLK